MIYESHAADLSIKETAVLSGTTEKIIRHELSEHVAHAARLGSHRRFGPREVAYFFIVKELPVELDKRLRKDLFDLLVEDKERAGEWRRETHQLVLEGHVPVAIMTDDVLKYVQKRIATFMRGRERLISRPEILGGEPVFEGTRISVRFVGERARKGEHVDVLLEDYPALKHEDIEFARMYVALGRRPGRPRKKLRFVRGEG